MKSFRVTFLLLACGCALAAASSAAADMNLGPLSLPWPQGYEVVRSAEPLVLRGPLAQEVAASVYLEPAPTDRAPGARERLVERSVALMRAGAGDRALRERRKRLPDGSTLAVVASAVANGYLLQFVVISPRASIGYITVQGTGDAAAAEEHLLPLFEHLRWVEPLPPTGGECARGSKVVDTQPGSA